MKHLQNNFTTPEQSKRLLELGLPKESADCYYLSYEDEYSNEIMVRTSGDLGDAFFKVTSSIPCWSVGRLIEIYEKLMGIPFTRYNLKISLLDEILDRYWQNKKQLDFSKWKE